MRAHSNSLDYFSQGSEKLWIVVQLSLESVPLVVLLALGGGTSANALDLRSSQKFMTRDQQFDLILSKLKSLPEHLKQADPKTYPNYEQELRRYVGDITLLPLPQLQ